MKMPIQRDILAEKWYNRRKGNDEKATKTLQRVSGMYKRKLHQVSMFDNPTMFGGPKLDPDNEWVKLTEILPWAAFEERYAEQFPSKKGQPACNFRMALGSLLIKERYQFSDEMTVSHIAMNPYLCGVVLKLRTEITD